MRQGNDVGTQYRSGIYFYDEEQERLALASRDAFQKELQRGGLRADHDRDRVRARILFRRGLPPAVPREEPRRLLRPRRHRRVMSDRPGRGARPLTAVYTGPTPEYACAMVRDRERPWSLVLATCGAVGLLATGCGGGSSEPPVDAGPPIDAPLEGFTALDVECPGGPGCASAGDGVLEVGAAAVPFTPTIVETYTDENGDHEYQSDEPYDDVNNNGEFDAYWLFGGARAAVGARTDIEARALALRQGDTTVALVYLDAVGLLLDDIDAIRNHPMLAGDDLDHVIIGATHAHDTPDTVGLWGRTEFVTGRVPAHIAALIDAAASAVHQAVAGLTPARMIIAKTLVLDDPEDPQSRTLQWNQDIRDPKIFDPSMTVARFVRDDAPTETIGTLINWADPPRGLALLRRAGRNQRALPALAAADRRGWPRDRRPVPARSRSARPRRRGPCTCRGRWAARSARSATPRRCCPTARRSSSRATRRTRPSAATWAARASRSSPTTARP
jgi:hypothetical protein